MGYLLSYTEILEQIDAIDPTAYTQTSSLLDGAVTKLSPYISRGIVTLPQVRDRVLANHPAENCALLLQELAHREYFQNVWWEKDDEIFTDLHCQRDDWVHNDLVTALVDANTNISTIDNGIKKLYDTGYMHNQLRLGVATIACNIAGAHWYNMARWLYYHLIDGDLATNFLSWQGVAGISDEQRKVINEALINDFKSEDPTGECLDVKPGEKLETEVPQILQIHETFRLDTEYPEVNEVQTVSGATVCLYTPWTLNPQWRQVEPARRILVIDPTWFDIYPVSEPVMDFIIRQGKTVIDDLEVHVGACEELPGLVEAANVYSLLHQTNRLWPVEFDAVAKLFPDETGYYSNFYKYWQAVSK